MEFETSMTATDFRANVADAMSRAEFGGERILVTRSGKPTIVVLGFADYQFMREREDEHDRNNIPEANIETKSLTKHPRTSQRRPRHLDPPAK